jgi:hypothetical protein
MSAVPFDTLKFARHLEASGLTASAPAGASEALAHALTGSDLVTKSDLAEVRTELKADIALVKTDLAAVKAELKGDIASLRTELKGDIASLRGDLKGDIAVVKGDIELLRRDITIKFGSMLVIAVGILLTAIRYLPPHP